MSILALLAGWKTKAMALLSGALLIAIGLLKYKSSKLERVEHELEIKDKKTEIKESQDEFKAEVMANEQDEILKEVDNNAKKSRDERNANL